MLRRGSVIRAVLRGPNGELILDNQGNPKERPALVLSSGDDIASGRDLVVAAISSKFDRHNLPAHWFRIPSAIGRHPVTGCDLPSVVKADWLQRIPQSDVCNVSPGVVAEPTRCVLNWLKQKSLAPPST